MGRNGSNGEGTNDREMGREEGGREKRSEEEQRKLTYFMVTIMKPIAMHKFKLSI